MLNWKFSCQCEYMFKCIELLQMDCLVRDLHLGIYVILLISVGELQPTGSNLGRLYSGLVASY